MNLRKWYDRLENKKKIQDWLINDETFILMEVDDLIEIQDIIKWVAEISEQFIPAKIYYPSDSRILKHDFLECLASEFVDKTIFPNFYNMFDNADSQESIPIVQHIGNSSKSKGELSYENIDQSVVVNYPSMTLENIRESLSYRLFEEFLKDIKKLCDKNSLLFIISFQKDGFDGFSADFKNWFLQKFCRNIASIKNIKIIIINQGKSQELEYLETNSFVIISEFIGFNDVRHATNDMGFCYGLIDRKTNQIEYRVFKRRWSIYRIETVENES